MGTIFRALNKSTHAEPSHSESDRRYTSDRYAEEQRDQQLQRDTEQQYYATQRPEPQPQQQYAEQPTYTQSAYQPQYAEERAAVEQPHVDEPRDLNIGQKVDDKIKGNSKWQRDLKKVAVNISVLVAGDEERAPIVMFTGIEERVGTSTIASNIAKLMVDLEEPKKVLLIDIASKNQAEYGENLLALLAEGVSAADIAVAHVQEGVTKLVLGATTENLQSVKLPYGFREFIHEASRVFDWVILDAPPFMTTPITDTVGRMADGVAVVARYGNTRIAGINACIESMEQLGMEPLGIVVNHRKYPIPSKLMKWL